MRATKANIGAIRSTRNVRPARRNRPITDVPQHDSMRSGNHVEHGRHLRWALRGLVALTFGIVAFMTLGAPVLMYLAGAGVDVILAVITAVTPPQ